jgi:hypothetical protein
MVEENKNEDETKTEDEQTKPKEKQDLKDDIDRISADAFKRRKEELLELEKKVDKKTEELKEIVEETLKAGKGYAIGPQKKEMTNREYAEKVLAGEIDPWKD